MDKLSVLCITLAGVSWGTAGLFSHFLQKYGFSPFQISAGRILLAAIFMLLFVLLYNPKVLKVQPKKLILYAISGLALLGTSCFYYWAMELTSFSTAVVLMYTAPVIVMIVSVLFLGEKFTWLKLTGVLGALLGCCFVTGIIGNLRFSAAGILVGLLSGISYSIYNICVKLEMNRGDDPIGATTYCFFFSFLASLFVINPVDSAKIIAVDPVPTLLLIAGMGFFIGAFPYLIYTFAMRKIPAGVASSMACIEPMTATIISILFLNEQLTVSAVIGIVMILGSVILLSRETDHK
ncbi:MAG: DMT family transporter [Clostridia bacterium]|nr:DMT family transporter [Clostridia bacterium]